MKMKTKNNKMENNNKNEKETNSNNNNNNNKDTLEPVDAAFVSLCEFDLADCFGREWVPFCVRPRQVGRPCFPPFTFIDRRNRMNRRHYPIITLLGSSAIDRRHHGPVPSS